MSEWVIFDGTNPPTDGNVVVRYKSGPQTFGHCERFGWTLRGKNTDIIAYLPIPDYVEPLKPCPVKGCDKQPKGYQYGRSYQYMCSDGLYEHKSVTAKDEPTARKWWNAGGE